MRSPFLVGVRVSQPEGLSYRSALAGCLTMGFVWSSPNARKRGHVVSRPGTAFGYSGERPMFLLGNGVQGRSTFAASRLANAVAVRRVDVSSWHAALESHGISPFDAARPEAVPRRDGEWRWGNDGQKDILAAIGRSRLGAHGGPDHQPGSIAKAQEGCSFDRRNPLRRRNRY